MTREQAINYLFSRGFTQEQVCEVVRALTYAPTTKNNLGVDCISRADAIQIMQDKAKKLTNEDTINGLCGAVAILFELPSVTLQEPRKGHWIVDVHRIRTFGSKNETHDYSVHCDKCNYEWDYTTDKEGSLVSNYCPNCGADMREVKE